MNDEETVALIAGGHTFGKTHGAGDRDATSAPSRKARRIEEQGLGWKSSYGTRQGRRHHHQRPRRSPGRTTPTQVEQQLLREPVRLRVGADQEPGRRAPVEAEGRRGRRHGARRARPVEAPRADHADHRPRAALRPGLREDLAALPSRTRTQFADAFARAWFKLTHRDMGPRARYLGPEVPKEELIWQDPIPGRRSSADRRQGHRRAEGQDPRLGPVGLAAGLDRLGLGVDLPRLRQARRRQRRAHPPRAAEGLGGQPAGAAREGAGEARRRSRRSSTPRRRGGKKVSLADLIVLGGCAAVEQAAKKAGHDVTVPFTPGRTDASQEQTDVAVVRACSSRSADGFRNYSARRRSQCRREELLVDRAQLLTLTAPEMTVLVGGLRVLDANVGALEARRLHQAAGDADQRLLRQPARHGHASGSRRRRARTCSKAATARPASVKWTGTRVDLVFGSQLAAARPRRGLRAAPTRRRSS